MRTSAARRSIRQEPTVWLIGVLVVLAHALSAWLLASRIGPLYEDAGEFHKLAAGLAAEFRYGPPDAFRPPGWPILLAAPYRVFGAHPPVGLSVTALLGGLTTVAVIRLGVQLSLSPNQAKCAGLLYGLFPWTVVIGSTLYAETLFNLVLVCVCSLIVWLKTAPRTTALWGWWLTVGGLAGYASLTRPVMAFWLPMCLLFALGRKVDIKALAAVVLGTSIILGLWTWRNYERLDAFVPLTTAGGYTLAMANNDLAGPGQSPKGLPRDSKDEVTADREYKSFATRWIKEHPGEFAKRVPQRIIRTFDPVTRLNKGVFGGMIPRWTARIMWLTALALIAIGISKFHRGPWVIPLSMCVALTAQVIAFGGGFRFLIPALPFLAIWGTVGAAAMFESRNRGSGTAGQE